MLHVSKSKVVRLNVGGILYHTSYMTLTAVAPESSLARAVQQYYETHLIEDDQQEMFIDRNGQLFGHILDYLRNPTDGVPVLVPRDQTILNGLKQEAEFYLLRGLVDKINEFLLEKNQPFLMGDCVKLDRTICASVNQYFVDWKMKYPVPLKTVFEVLGISMKNDTPPSSTEHISSLDLLKWYGYVSGTQDNFCVVRLKIFRGATVKNEDVLVPMSVLMKF